MSVDLRKALESGRADVSTVYKHACNPQQLLYLNMAHLMGKLDATFFTTPDAPIHNSPTNDDIKVLVELNSYGLLTIRVTADRFAFVVWGKQRIYMLQTILEPYEILMNEMPPVTSDDDVKFVDSLCDRATDYGVATSSLVHMERLRQKAADSGVGIAALDWTALYCIAGYGKEAIGDDPLPPLIHTILFALRKQENLRPMVPLTRGIEALPDFPRYCNTLDDALLHSAELPEFVYRRAESIVDLLRIHMAFMESRMPYTPNYAARWGFGGDQGDHAKAGETLHALHTYGIFTVGGADLEEWATDDEWRRSRSDRQPSELTFYMFDPALTTFVYKAMKEKREQERERHRKQKVSPDSFDFCCATRQQLLRRGGDLVKEDGTGRLKNNYQLMFDHAWEGLPSTRALQSDEPRWPIDTINHLKRLYRPWMPHFDKLDLTHTTLVVLYSRDITVEEWLLRVLKTSGIKQIVPDPTYRSKH